MRAQWTIAFCALTAGAACRGNTSPTPPVHTDTLKTRVRIVKPKKEDLALSSALIGTLRPWRESVLATRLAGEVISLSVERGDRVKRGQSLGMIRVPGLPQELASAIANQDVAEASLLEQRDLADRTKRVAGVNVAAVSSQEVDMSAAKATTAAAKLRSAQADASRVRALLGDAQITAPLDGVVLVRYVDPGSSVSAGTRLVQIADVGILQLVVDVPEREVPHVKPGAGVSITLAALGERKLEAKISRYAPALDPSTRMLRVEIDLQNDGSLVAGSEARVRFVDATAKGVITLPADALVVRGDGQSVFVAKDGRAASVPIVVGFDDGAKFEVRKGLDGSEEVIIGGGGLLEDGAPIEVAR